VLKLVITDDEGRTTVVPLDRDELSIGRGEGNTIRLTERNVSRKHCVLRRVARGFEIEDLKSYNGTKVAGSKITAPRLIRDGERIQIGDYQVTMQSARAPVRVVRDGTKTTQIAADAETALFALPEGSRTEAAPAPRPVGKPRFVVEAGPVKGKTFLIDKDELTMGQAPECEIRLDHASVSRAHAKIVNVGGVRILDLQSTNGVRVNGRDVPYAELEPGDVVELGEVRLRFLVPGAQTRSGAGAGSRSTWLLGGVAGGFVVVALVLFVAWPAPSALPGNSTPAVPGPTPAPGAAATGTSNETTNSAAMALIQTGRNLQRTGQLDEAQEVGTRARSMLQARSLPTTLADDLLHDLEGERRARAELERAREQMTRSPEDALASLDRIDPHTDTASDPGVAQIAAEALGSILGHIERESRAERAQARTQIEGLLGHPRLAPSALPAELEKVRRDARALRESLAEPTATATGPGPGPRPPRAGNGPREGGGPTKAPPDEPRPAGDAQEDAAYARLRAAASDPGRYKQLACQFMNTYPSSRRAGMARSICRQ
jgi:pSer/pThr/pTyr-binding forkhead associated (FHA) protein